MQDRVSMQLERDARHDDQQELAQKSLDEFFRLENIKRQRAGLPMRFNAEESGIRRQREKAIREGGRTIAMAQRADQLFGIGSRLGKKIRQRVAGLTKDVDRQEREMLDRRVRARARKVPNLGKKGSKKKRCKNKR